MTGIKIPQFQSLNLFFKLCATFDILNSNLLHSFETIVVKLFYQGKIF